MNKLVVGALITILLSACAPAQNATVGENAETVPNAGSDTNAGNSTSSSSSSTAPTTDNAVSSLLTSSTAARPSSAANVRVCKGKSSVAGVDVSDYDPGVTWASVYKAGQGFTFIKASEGTSFTDKYFATDWTGSSKAGLIRGAYHFFHASEDPTLQAQNFMKVVGALGAGDLPAMFDWEIADGVSSAVAIARAKTWLALIEKATGKIPVIYTAPAFWNSLGNPQGFERYPLFIANYGVSCPDIPPPWTTWTFWQSSESGKVSGISGEVDLDAFNGSLAQLVQFAMTGKY